jgi:hypothetical protein
LPFETTEGRKILGKTLTESMMKSTRRPIFERKSLRRESSNPLKSPFFYEILCEGLKKDLRKIK